MACHCFSWRTGASVCIGRIPGPFGGFPVENCRSACRASGMGVLCHDENGECGNDSCDTGDQWRTSRQDYGRYFLCATCYDAHPDIQIFDEQLIDLQVMVTCTRIPPVDLPPTIYIDPSLSCDTLIQLLGEETFRIVVINGTPVVIGRVATGGLCPNFNQGFYLTRSVYTPFVATGRSCTETKTPCCLDTGSIRCRFIPPATCIRLCGQPYEGTISWSNPTNPCAMTGDAHPCNRRPCCLQPYPVPYPPANLDDIGNAERYDPYCRPLTTARCSELGGHSAMTSRSCFRPGGCYGEETDPCFIDGHCVGGLWELAYRPEGHKPPISKEWLEGSAEIVSSKPERLLEPDGGPGDCKYHYGDVGYSRFGDADRSSGQGSAAGVVCAVKASRQSNESFNTYNWCPMVYGEDGNARFSCGYRVAEN